MRAILRLVGHGGAVRHPIAQIMVAQSLLPSVGGLAQNRKDSGRMGPPGRVMKEVDAR